MKDVAEKKDKDKEDLDPHANSKSTLVMPKRPEVKISSYPLRGSESAEQFDELCKKLDEIIGGPRPDDEGEYGDLGPFD